MEKETVEVLEDGEDEVKDETSERILKAKVQVGEKICPKCGKSFKPAGLAGHLRFAHGFNSEKATEATKTAKINKATSFDGIFELIEKIEKVRERKEALEEKYSSFFGTPEAIQEALEALEEQEKLLMDEIRRLRGGKRKKGSSLWDFDPLAFLNEEQEEKTEKKVIEDSRLPDKNGKKLGIFDFGKRREKTNGKP